MHTIRELLDTGSRVHPGAGHRLIRGAHTRFVFGASMLLLAGLLGAAPALAADWYTSPSGSDGSSCSSALAPCLTIQAAINKAAAGDTSTSALATIRSTMPRAMPAPECMSTNR